MPIQAMDGVPLFIICSIAGYLAREGEGEREGIWIGVACVENWNSLGIAYCMVGFGVIIIRCKSRQASRKRAPRWTNSVSSNYVISFKLS